MGDIEVEISVSKKDIAAVPTALNVGLSEGLEESGEWMLEHGEDRAKDVILSAERIWRGRLKEGFTSEPAPILQRRSYYWQGEIRNDAPHAELNERGLKPGTKPPIQKILPWIDDQLGASLPRVTDSTYNVSNWDEELQALAAKYEPSMIVTSFAIQKHLEDEGYPGIGFMETTESYLQQVGPPIVKAKVEAAMRRKMRESGLS